MRAAAVAAAARCGGGRGRAGLVALHAPPGRQVVAPPEAGWGLPGAGFARVLAAPPPSDDGSSGDSGPAVWERALRLSRLILSREAGLLRGAGASGPLACDLCLFCCANFSDLRAAAESAAADGLGEALRDLGVGVSIVLWGDAATDLSLRRSLDPLCEVAQVLSGCGPGWGAWEGGARRWSVSMIPPRPPPQPRSTALTTPIPPQPRPEDPIVSYTVWPLMRSQVLRVAHSEELEEAVALDADITACSLEECQVGWEALEGGLGDFPLRVEPALDPEDEAPGPSGAPPPDGAHFKPPPSHGEILGGGMCTGLLQCRDESARVERSAGNGSQELAIRFESPDGEGEGPFVRLSCLKRMVAALTQPLVSVDVGKVMQSGRQMATGGVGSLSLEPVSADKGTLSLHLLCSGDLALIWTLRRPHSPSIFANDADENPTGWVLATVPCRNAHDDPDLAKEPEPAPARSNAAIEWAREDETGRTFCVKNRMMDPIMGMHPIVGLRCFWLCGADPVGARGLVDEMAAMLREPPSVAEILKVDQAVVRALAPSVTGASTFQASPSPATQALAHPGSPTAAGQAREMQVLRRNMAQTALARRYRDGAGGVNKTARKCPAGLKSGFLAPRPGSLRQKYTVAAASDSIGGEAADLGSDDSQQAGIAATEERDADRAGPPTTAEASSSGRSSDAAWVEGHEGEVQESGTAVQGLKPAVAVAGVQEGTATDSGGSSCQVNVANLMEVLSPCRCRAGATEIGSAAESRPDSAPPERRLIPAAAARPPHPAPRAPRNLRSSRCSPEVLGPHGEPEDKVDICNIAELMKPPSPCKPAPPSS